MEVLNREGLDLVENVLSQDVIYVFQLNGRTLRCKFDSYRLHVLDAPDDLLVDLFNAIGIYKPATYISRHFYNIEDRDVGMEGNGERLESFPESIRGLANYPQKVRLMMEWMYNTYDRYIGLLTNQPTTSSVQNPRVVKSRLSLPVMGSTTIPNISISVLPV